MRLRKSNEPLVCPECEPDPYISIATCSYLDGDGVTGSQSEIEKCRTHFLLISEDVVAALGRGGYIGHRPRGNREVGPGLGV